MHLVCRRAGAAVATLTSSVSSLRFLRPRFTFSVVAIDGAAVASRAGFLTRRARCFFTAGAFTGIFVSAPTRTAPALSSSAISYLLYSQILFSAEATSESMRGTDDAKLLAAAAARDVVRKHRLRSNCRGRSVQLQRHEGDGIAGEPVRKRPSTAFPRRIKTPLANQLMSAWFLSLAF